jgi:hypothetical protein
LSDMRAEGRIDRDRLGRTEIEVEKIRQELQPIVSHVGAVRVLFRWIIGVGGVSSAVLAIAKLTNTL